MKILVIGAHQDDNEFRVGGTAEKYIKLGHEVRFLTVTNGCRGHHIMTTEETKVRRAKEAEAVAKLLGIRYDIWYDIDDCTVTADLQTRRRMIRYIREYSPDIVFTHRTNDYHPDHRATGLLVQDASYLLTVPNECPDTPAMRKMPVIMFLEDPFKYPPFQADVIVDIDENIETKLKCAHLNESQVYEWLPFVEDFISPDEIPEDEEERFRWLKGMEITSETTDEEVMAAPRGYAVRFAKVAARFRKELIDKYGFERGSKVRYAEAFCISEYGTQLTEETKKILFPF